MLRFEILKEYVGLDSGAKRFLPITDREISEAESELGFVLPENLKNFYRAIGYGWIGSESRADLRNLIIHPLDIVDLYRGESEFSPPDSFLEGDLPIFDCGGNRFLVVRPDSGDREKIYRDDGGDEAVAADIEDLINKLLSNPDFYEK